MEGLQEPTGAGFDPLAPALKVEPPQGRGWVDPLGSFLDAVKRRGVPDRATPLHVRRLSCQQPPCKPSAEERAAVCTVPGI